MPEAQTADDRAYWESRLAERYSLDGVGYLGLGSSFNAWMYRARRTIFLRRARPLVTARPAARVLDVGSGTGFYVGLWQELGVRSITGSDITAKAVGELRQAYPEHEFIRFDAGAEVVPLPASSFDLISAFDVLFHVTDDARFRRALRNLAGLLRPGGMLLFTDNLLHGETVRSTTQVSRSLPEVEAAVRDAGLEIVSRRPALYLMNYPIDSESIALHLLWRVLPVITNASRAAGWLAGAALYPIDMLLTRRMAEGPTTEMVFCSRPA
jgi:SAM-dependent methyltransferase